MSTSNTVGRSAGGRLPGGESPAPKQKWGADKREAFAALKPASLILVATDGPVSVTLWQPGGRDPVRRLGHNRAVWPAKLVRSGSIKDTATPTYDKGPLFFVGAQFRRWFLTEEHRDRVAESVVDLIGARAKAEGGLEDLEHGFQDLGPDLDLDFFEMEVAGIARRIAGHGWDDDEFSRFLGEVVAEVDRLKRTGNLRAHELERAYEAAAVRLCFAPADTRSAPKAHEPALPALAPSGRSARRPAGAGG